jgi:hypothetical protein
MYIHTYAILDDIEWIIYLYAYFANSLAGEAAKTNRSLATSLKFIDDPMNTHATWAPVGLPGAA